VSKQRSSGGLGQSKWLMVAALIAAVLMGIGRLGSGLIDSGSGGGPVPEPDCAAAIAWDEAAEHEGDQETVRGPVVGATYAENVSGQPTFLNLGADHPDRDRFTVVIWNDVRTQFEQRPEALFAGQEICVAGEIQIHDDGSSQIELRGPRAITFAD
jgi:hypothetical protein